MPNIEKGSHFPVKRNISIEQIIFKNVDFNFQNIELIITIEDENLNIKELSSYLDYIYKIDGKLNPIGFLSYSRMPRVQIEISRMRRGSWEIIIEKLIGTPEGQNLMILFLVLKYLPSVIKATLDSAHRVYEILNIREDVIEKREKRSRKSPLRDAMDKDQLLMNATKEEKDKLYKIISKFYKNKNLAASRFSQKYIKKIELNPKIKN